MPYYGYDPGTAVAIGGHLLAPGSPRHTGYAGRFLWPGFHHADGETAWQRLAPLEDYNLVVEQHLLCAHLIASAKSDLRYLNLLASRVKNHFPADFEIVRREFGDQ